MKVRFLPEFCETLADSINLVGMFGGITEKEVGVEIEDKLYSIKIHPELILEFLPYHQAFQSQMLKEDDEFMLLATRQGEPEQLLILDKDDIAVLMKVVDKIIAGARGELVPDLQGEIEVVPNS